MNPYTYEAAREAKFLTLEEQWEAAFCCRAIVTEIGGKLPDTDGLPEDEKRMVRDANKALAEAWEALRTATNAMGDLRIAQAKRAKAKEA